MGNIGEYWEILRGGCNFGKVDWIAGCRGEIAGGVVGGLLHQRAAPAQKVRLL